MLVEKNERVREEEIITKIMNNYLTNVTLHLKLKPIKIYFKASLESIINTSQNPESIQGIKLTNFHSKFSFKFNSVSELDFKKEILSLSSKKVPEKVIFQPRYLKAAVSLTYHK